MDASAVPPSAPSHLSRVSSVGDSSGPAGPQDSSEADSLRPLQPQLVAAQSADTLLWNDSESLFYEVSEDALRGADADDDDGGDGDDSSDCRGSAGKDCGNEQESARSGKPVGEVTAGSAGERQSLKLSTTRGTEWDSVYDATAAKPPPSSHPINGGSGPSEWVLCDDAVARNDPMTSGDGVRIRSNSHRAEVDALTAVVEAEAREQQRERAFRAHRKHVFILSSAGKPIFTRHGDESDFSELFGVLQVLISMAQSCPVRSTSRTGTETGTGTTIEDHLRRVTSGSDQTIYFHTEGEVYTVMVCKTNESAKSCVRQMRLFLAHLMSVVPNVNDILRKSPGYDVRRLLSPADVAVLRALIKATSTEESFLFRAVVAAPLAPHRRRFVESILAMQQLPSGLLFSSRDRGRPRTSTTGYKDDLSVEAAMRYGEGDEDEDDSGSAGGGCERSEEAQPNSMSHLFSFLFFRGAVVAAVSLEGERSKLALDDMLLLVNFTRYLCDSQAGEVWAPLCLPKFNNTGYLWCYCVNLSVTVREMEHQRDQVQEQLRQPAAAAVASSLRFRVAPMIDPTIARGNGILMVQLAASQDAFSKLSFRSRRVARQLAQLVPELETEMVGRWRFPLAAATSSQILASPKIFRPGSTGQQPAMPSLATPELEVHLDSTLSQGVCRASANSLAATAAAAPLVLAPPSTSTDGLLYMACMIRPGVAAASRAGSTPSGGSDSAPASAVGREERMLSQLQLIASAMPPQLAFNRSERKRVLRMFVKLRDKLSLLLRAPAPLLLCRVREYTFVLARPSPAFFLASAVPTKPSTVQTEGLLRTGSDVTAAGVGLVHQWEPDMELANSAASAIGRSGISEVLLLFAPSTPKEVMMRCIAKVVRNVHARELEYTFQYVPWKSVSTRRSQ